PTCADRASSDGRTVTLWSAPRGSPPVRTYGSVRRAPSRITEPPTDVLHPDRAAGGETARGGGALNGGGVDGHRVAARVTELGIVQDKVSPDLAVRSSISPVAE